MKKKIIGITGGIGSGKSTVSNIFEEKGFHVLKADDIAKHILNQDNNVIKKVIANFGNDCYDQGKLNTKVVSQKVFNNPDKLKILNNIVHPPTIAKIKNEISKLIKDNSIVFVEAALIFEANMQNIFDYVLLITAEENTRINRVLSRNTETISEIKSRMMNQIPEKEKRNKSDFTIDNDRSIEELQNKSLFFLNLFNSFI